jgi:hypothetical protein
MICVGMKSTLSIKNCVLMIERETHVPKSAPFDKLRAGYGAPGSVLALEFSKLVVS